MKKNLFFLGYFLVLNIYPQTGIDFITANSYISKINNGLASNQLYIRASAFSYSKSDPVNPTDIGEFLIARKGHSTYINFKGQESYINKEYSVLIDTTEKSLIVTKSGVVPYSKIDIHNFDQCQSVSFRQVKESNYILVFKFNPGNEYKQVEIIFDTSTLVLQRINMDYSENGSFSISSEVKRIEIIYNEILTDLPSRMDSYFEEDIISINRKKQVEIKAKQYIAYTLINLLEL